MPDVRAVRVEDNDDESSAADSHRKPLLVCIIVVLVLGIGGALAWFFLTQNDSNVPVAPPPTGLPTIYTDISNSPSVSPSSDPQLYDAPSSADCIKIVNQQMVSNQDAMIATPFGLDFDITIVEGADTALWVATFMASLIRNLVPDLTGCDRIRRNLFLETSSSWDHDDYYHRDLKEIRYAIGNVNVTGEFQLGRACEEQAPVPCFRFVVKMDFYLKGTLSNFQLIELVVGIINPPGSTETLVQRMELPTSLFQKVAIVLLGSTSESPTSSPAEEPPPV